MTKPSWLPDITKQNPPTPHYGPFRGRRGRKRRTRGEEEERVSTCHMLAVTGERSLEAQTDWPRQTYQPQGGKNKTSLFRLTPPNCAMINHTGENTVKKYLQLKQSVSNCMAIFKSRSPRINLKAWIIIASPPRHIVLVQDSLSWGSINLQRGGKFTTMWEKKNKKKQIISFVLTFHK